MFNIALGVGILSVATALLVIFRAREGTPHPAIRTTPGKAFPLALVALLVFGIGLIIHELTARWM